MLKEGRTSTLPLLTNEAVNKEKRIFEERLREVQEELRQKDGVIKDKDTRIAALDEQCTSWRSHVFAINSRPNCSGDDTSRLEGRDCPHADITE